MHQLPHVTVGAGQVVSWVSCAWLGLRPQSQSTNNLKRFVKLSKCRKCCFPNRWERSVQEQSYKCGVFRTCISEYGFQSQKLGPQINNLKQGMHICISEARRVLFLHTQFSSGFYNIDDEISLHLKSASPESRVQMHCLTRRMTWAQDLPPQSEAVLLHLR